MGKNDKIFQSRRSVDPAANARLVQEAEAPGSDVTDEQLREDDTDPESWLQYNKGLRQLGYSPASRITRENVGELELAYTLDHAGAQFNPIVVPSGRGDPPVMYFPEGQSVRAINARTGDAYWEYTYSPEYGGGARNRGVSVRGDKVYFCGNDLRLLTLDRYTGERQWRTHAVSERQREEMEPSTQRLANTGAPLVFDGTVIKGQSGEGGNWGAIVAIDAETGDARWDYDVIPKEEWTDETWRHGDGAPWTTPTVDPESGLIIVPTGNPSPQINGAVRPGPNKHTNSLIALDATTGEVEWTHQFVAHDWWDYDVYLARVFDTEIDGEPTRVVQAEDKTGWIYAIDVETGQLLRRSEPHANQGAELEFMEIPPAGRENAMEKSPTAIGATDWHPDGYSPETGLVYIGSIDDYMGSWYDPDWTFEADSLAHSIGGGKEYIANPESGERAARVTAIDPASGEIEWATPYDDDSEPFWPGGNTPTGGNLVFAGNNGGQFRALDAETGDVLWEEQLNQSFSASPVVWDDPAENTQYVAVASASTLNVYSLKTSQPDDDGDETGDDDGTDDDGTGDNRTGDNGTGDDGNDDNGTTDGDDTIPGFGPAAGAAGIASGVYAAKKVTERLDEGDDADTDS